MAYNQALADRICEAFKARGVVFEIKIMMGGPCFMVDGKMCVGVADKRLMVRLDPALDGAVMERPGCKQMDFTGRPMKGFVFVDPIGTEAKSDLDEWLQLALEFNPRAKASKKASNNRPKNAPKKQKLS